MDIGVKGMGYVDIGVRSMGYVDTGVRSMGYVDIGVRSMGYVDIGVRSMGYVDIGVRGMGYEDFRAGWSVPAGDCRLQCECWGQEERARPPSQLNHLLSSDTACHTLVQYL